jgi:signal transduction histidine kinase
MAGCAPVRQRAGMPANRWLMLFLLTRGAATAIAAVLLAVHRVTSIDATLIVVVLAYGLGSMALAVRRPAVQGAVAWWVLDAAVALGLVVFGHEWRSPFYLLGVTALVLPATTLRFRRALGFGVAYTVAYFCVAVSVGVDWSTLESTSRLESFSTHLLVPLVVTLSLAYAAALLDRLRDERERSERLALESERRRIAWELHDSAKQRVHAAHLVLSALEPDGDDGPVEVALAELRAAVADMETSVQDLRSPLPPPALGPALRRRAAELGRAGQVAIDVEGDAPPLPAFIGIHAHRIAAEALANAVRHAGASRILVRLGVEDGMLRILVRDDGRGMPEEPPSGGSGLHSMHNRARAIGARLTVGSREAERGSAVCLEIPLTTTQESIA